MNKRSSFEFINSISNQEREILKKIHNRKNTIKILGEVVFGGNNFIFCMWSKNSRCFGGNIPQRIYASLILLNLPSLILYFSTIPRLAPHDDISDSQRDLLSYVPTRQTLTIIGCILQLITSILMLMTSLSDPGVVPKNYWDKIA